MSGRTDVADSRREYCRRDFVFSAGFRRIPRLTVVLSSDTPILLRTVERHTIDQTAIEQLFAPHGILISSARRILFNHILVHHPNGPNPHAACVAPWLRSARSPAEGNTRSRHLCWIIADVGYTPGAVSSSCRSSPETAGRFGETIVFGTVTDHCIIPLDDDF